MIYALFNHFAKSRQFRCLQGFVKMHIEVNPLFVQDMPQQDLSIQPGIFNALLGKVILCPFENAAYRPYFISCHYFTCFSRSA